MLPADRLVVLTGFSCACEILTMYSNYSSTHTSLTTMFPPPMPRYNLYPSPPKNEERNISAVAKVLTKSTFHVTGTKGSVHVDFLYVCVLFCLVPCELRRKAWPKLHIWLFPFCFLKNSGLGNTVNPLMSLAAPGVYNLPMLLMCGWRGEPGKKDEPQHMVQGNATPGLLGEP